MEADLEKVAERSCHGRPQVNGASIVNRLHSEGVETTGRGRSGAGTIVVGFDDSPAAFHALAWAAGEAHRTNRNLIAVHILPPAGAMIASSVITESCNLAEEAFAITCRELEALADQVGRDVGVPIEFRRGLGDRSKELIRIATSAGADLVVVGRSQKTIHRVAGSLGRKLASARSAPIVVVVP